ncbi:MAG: hypothetical protein IIV24_06305 [Alistipes sp.]|nr:hypothetical protein [Alistipes sp.]
MAAFFVEASRSFSWWRLGRVVCAVVGIVAEAYCCAIYKHCADSQNTNKFVFGYQRNPCNFVACLRPNTPCLLCTRLRQPFDSLNGIRYQWSLNSNPAHPYWPLLALNLLRLD